MSLLEVLGVEQERDACAIIASVKRNGEPSHGNVKRTLEALTKMGHRTGEIAGEGDGAGIQTDIPREIWKRRLEAEGLIGDTVNHPYFTVAHLLLPAAETDAAVALTKLPAVFFTEPKVILLARA